MVMLGTDWVRLASSSSCCSPRPHQSLPNDRFWSGAAGPAAQHHSDLLMENFLGWDQQGEDFWVLEEAQPGPGCRGKEAVFWRGLLSGSAGWS